MRRALYHICGSLLCLAAPIHAATFTVTSTNDSGSGSLRQAILDANLTPHLDVVTFNIPGTGPHRIAPLTPLPAITNTLIIDGYTQPGANPNALHAGNNAVFKIELDGSNAGAGANGLAVQATNSVVRGLVINRFGGNGIVITGIAAAITIEGNLIGTDLNGTVARPNGDGIFIAGIISGVQIGGSVPSARNVISGNIGTGIYITGSYPVFHASAIIQGNFIGTDKNGTASLGNSGDGIRMDLAAIVTVGGLSAGAGNIIAANGGNGISIQHRSAGNVSIDGNSIGTDLTATLPLGNALDGIFTTESAPTQGVRKNTIAANLGNGIRLSANSFFYDSLIVSNSIFSNGALGINLQRVPGESGANIVTPNDGGDADTGPNRLQNFPVITNVVTTAGSTTISGTLNSTANSAFTIELFRNLTADASGYGEGKFSLGSTNVTTDGSGNGAFHFQTGETCAGQSVTATASSAATSEFSQAIVVPGPFGGNFQFKSAEFVGTEGGSAVLVEVVRTDSATSAATVDFSTLSDTATAASDFTATNGTLTFAAGETNQTFLVNLGNDAAGESVESLFLTLSNPTTNTALGTVRTATLTILDDELLPAISINDITLAEGNTGGSFAIFTVSLSAPNSAPVSVAYTTFFGSAGAGSDFSSSSDVVTFAPGETEAPITVVVFGDTLAELNETFSIYLSNPTNATIAGSVGTATILNDDGTPQISIGNAATTEGNPGSKQLVFPVTLSASSGQTVQAGFFTTDNTAIAGSDYQALTGTVTFSPGQFTQSLSITIWGDLVYESDETFFVYLTNVTGATIATGQGIGTIINDEAAPPSISINNLDVTEGNSGSTFAAFTVSLSTTNAQTVNVSYATSNGTATAGVDYTSISGSLVFNPGETIKPVTVTIKGDTVAEPNETFFVNLSNPTNATLVQASGTTTIVNDDNLSLQIARAANQVALSWSTNSSGFFLSANPTLGPTGQWQILTNPVVISNGWNTVLDLATNTTRLYRLQTQ